MCYTEITIQWIRIGQAKVDCLQKKEPKTIVIVSGSLRQDKALLFFYNFQSFPHHFSFKGKIIYSTCQTGNIEICIGASCIYKN